MTAHPYAEYSPFRGDGRRKVHPTPFTVPTGTRPMSVTHAQARRLIDEFRAHGATFHSGAGSMVWIVVTWAKHNNVPHRVVPQRLRREVVGYVVERKQ